MVDSWGHFHYIKNMAQTKNTLSIWAILNDDAKSIVTDLLNTNDGSGDADCDLIDAIDGLVSLGWIRWLDEESIAFTEDFERTLAQLPEGSLL